MGRKLLVLIKFPFDGSRQREPQKRVLDTENPSEIPYSLLPTESSGSLTCSVYSTDTRRRSSPYLPGRNQYWAVEMCLAQGHSEKSVSDWGRDRTGGLPICDPTLYRLSYLGPLGNKKPTMPWKWQNNHFVTCHKMKSIHLKYINDYHHKHICTSSGKDHFNNIYRHWKTTKKGIVQEMCEIILISYMFWCDWVFIGIQ